MRSRRVAVDAPNRLVIDGFVEVLVLDHDKSPLPGVMCELRLPAGPPRLGLSDTRGIARFPSVPLSHASCSILIHPKAAPAERTTSPAGIETVEPPDDDAEGLDIDAQEPESHDAEPEDDEVVCGPPVDDGADPDDSADDAED